jgi:metal-responsive CopG/Arc/MetJ family transcriptional regulator
MMDEIDAIVAGRYDQPDRSAIIRELLAEALAARRRKAG